MNNSKLMAKVDGYDIEVIVHNGGSKLTNTVSFIMKDPEADGFVIQYHYFYSIDCTKTVVPPTNNYADYICKYKKYHKLAVAIFNQEFEWFDSNEDLQAFIDQFAIEQLELTIDIFKLWSDGTTSEYMVVFKNADGEFVPYLPHSNIVYDANGDFSELIIDMTGFVEPMYIRNNMPEWEEFYNNCVLTHQQAVDIMESFAHTSLSELLSGKYTTKEFIRGFIKS